MYDIVAFMRRKVLEELVSEGDQRALQQRNLMESLELSMLDSVT